jgi:hypothetical protein
LSNAKASYDERMDLLDAKVVLSWKFKHSYTLNIVIVLTFSTNLPLKSF